MDFIDIAGKAVSLIQPYLSQSGEAITARLGVGLAGKFTATASKLLSKVREKFTKNDKAMDDLSEFVLDPQSKGRQSVVEELLSRFMEEDRQFAKEISDLVVEALSAGGDTYINTMTISDSSVAGDITMIGKVENYAPTINTPVNVEAAANRESVKNKLGNFMSTGNALLGSAPQVDDMRWTPLVGQVWCEIK